VKSSTSSRQDDFPLSQSNTFNHGLTKDQNVYDYVIPVPRIENPHPANLDLMGRRDLRSAFTKINLWNQTQFRRIVYLDADVVAYRAPDELFDLPHPFAAAPDIGWPDIFNTGVMVLTPNPDDYNAMMDMAQRGQSFDGADQGLLNEYYKDKYHRLSFTYNVTPSAHYQYVPAYQHFQANINLVHFIGTDKPWVQGRQTTSTGSGPFDHMVGKWWAVYDRHYKVLRALFLIGSEWVGCLGLTCHDIRRTIHRNRHRLSCGILSRANSSRRCNMSCRLVSRLHSGMLNGWSLVSFLGDHKPR
jgi:hypothetical protein